jgi:hypothetical protein
MLDLLVDADGNGALVPDIERLGAFVSSTLLKESRVELAG